jgi:hypothetical protein
MKVGRMSERTHGRDGHDGTRPDGSETLARTNARLAVLQIENEQLRTALETRIVIEQAKGILSERLRIDLEDAFLLLRRSARTSRRQLHAIAAAVTGSRETPMEVLASLDGDG